MSPRPRTRTAAGKPSARYGIRRTVDTPPTAMIPVESVGSRPRDRYADRLPISDPQLAVLEQMRAGITRPADIGRALSRSQTSIIARLYALGDRGLVEQVPGQCWLT